MTAKTEQFYIQQIAELQSQLQQRDKQITQLLNINAELAKKVEQLTEKVAKLSKNSSNSSKPPSSDIVKPSKTTKANSKKRNKGAQPGHPKYCRPAFNSDQIDKIIEYYIEDKEAIGLIALDEWEIIQQVILPRKMFKVIEHRARKYIDPVTGTEYVAAIPDNISKGGLFGASLTAMTAFMKGSCHMSYTTMQQFFREVMKLNVSRGMLCNAVKKVSKSLEPAYRQLATNLPSEYSVGIDETGHKDNGNKHWTWCCQTPQYSFYHIDKSRGSDVLFELLGQDFNGIIGCDYWGGYRKFSRLTNATVQYCMAHLIREIKFFAEQTDKKLSCWSSKLIDWLKLLFKAIHKRKKLSAKYFINETEKIKQGFLNTVRHPPNNKMAKKLSKRFNGKAAESYFLFLNEPNVEPTNNGTEREIRHTVIDRRITQGTRGQAGIQWCQRIWTTIATCKKQNQNVFDFIHQSLLADWKNNSYPSLL